MSKQKRTSTARLGYQPDIKQPIKDVVDLIGAGDPITLASILEDVGGQDREGEIAQQDRELIDQYLDTFSDVKDRLDTIDETLDQQLSTLEIPYDPVLIPELHDAQQHICGRPGSANVITYNDIKHRLTQSPALVRSLLQAPNTLDQMDAMNVNQVVNYSSAQIDKMVKQMILETLRYIIAYVLDFFAKLLSPLRGILYVKAVPKALESAANRFRNSGRSVSPLTIADEVAGLSFGEQGEITSETLTTAGGGIKLETIQETAQAIVSELPPQCLQHNGRWLQLVETMVQGTTHAPVYYAKKANIAMRQRIDELDKLAGLGIPNGYLYENPNGTSIRYNNPLPEEYIQARADGSTRFRAFGEGLVSSINKVKDTYLPRMERFVKRLLQDPTILCCLIKNLVALVSLSDLKKVLLYIQAILLLWRNLLTLDIASELAKLGNIIMDIVNNLLNKIFQLYISKFNSKLNSAAIKVKDLLTLKNVSARCQPWLELLDMAAQILSDIIQKITDYITDFFSRFNLELESVNISVEKAEQLATIDRLLSIINKIIQFTAAWVACVETGNDPNSIKKYGDRIVVNNSKISIAPLTNAELDPTVGAINAQIKSAQQVTTPTDATTQTGQQGVTNIQGSAFGSEGLEVLLTNFIGIEPSTAKKVINETNDCSCDKGLTADELSLVTKILKG